MVSINCQVHYIGEYCFGNYTTFKFEEDEKNTLPNLIEKSEHFLTKEKVNYERYQYLSYHQQSSQTFKNFVKKIKERSMNQVIYKKVQFQKGISLKYQRYQPLLKIFKKYDFEVIYRRGKGFILEDALS